MNIQPISTSLPLQSSNPEASAAPREARASVPTLEKIATEQTAKAAKPASQDQLKTAVKSVREYVQPFNNNLEFSINDDIDSVVVKIVDIATKEVIRQIPSEEMIAIAKALDSIKGLFIKQMA